MTTAKKIWPHTEVAAHLDEILQLAANGVPQQISRPDGTTFVIQKNPVTEEKPFVSTFSVFENFPKGAELVIDRPKDPPRDIDL